MYWKKVKGIKQDVTYCPKCHKFVYPEDFDEREDMCVYCLFPETSDCRPAEFRYDYGDPKNITNYGYMITNIEDIPRKVSKGDAERARKYKERTYNR